MIEEKINQVISLTEKKLELLKELKESLKYEKCIYHMVEHNELPIRYSLVRIKDKHTVIYGTIDKIKSFIKLRNIDKKLIYEK